jgi:hypothetical protein
VSQEAVYALLARILQGVMMLVVGVTVIWRLSPAEQGYFFSFMSFGALLQMADFGISYAVLHQANHLASIGQTSRLHGLFSRAIGLNCKSSLAFSSLVCLSGVLIFSAAQQTPEITRIVWLHPWLAFVGAMFLAQLIVPGIAFVEGGVSAIAAWRFRFYQELLSGPVLVLCLAYGFGLWSLAAFWIFRFALSAIWLWRNKPRSNNTTAFGYREWYQEVWPFQWKIGLSALNGFLVFQAINPIVLAEQGPTVAGQFGFSLAIMNMVLMVTTVWPISKAAHYGNLISTKQFDTLRHGFWQVTLPSSLLALCAALGISIVLGCLTILKIPHLDRLADWLTTSTLLAAAVVHHIVHCCAVVLRAERREPLLLINIIGGILTVFALWLSARFGNPHAIAATNLCCTLAGLLLVYFIFRRRMAFWRATQAPFAESSP